MFNKSYSLSLSLSCSAAPCSAAPCSAVPCSANPCSATHAVQPNAVRATHAFVVLFHSNNYKCLAYFFHVISILHGIFTNS